MRPTTSIMLQQNNNNNYPCLNVSGSTRELLQRCSRASLPFPSRLELGLGDLPLIRGLRAWALCSKNRCKAVGPLGGGQAPTAPPAGHGSSTSCPRPANVYLSGEWGRMGYGLPLGLDGRQAGIGALVTVATLKTSEGSGKTQTQCLFLHTEKGSCLYSTAKPGAGVISSAASSGVGGWLRGKTGVGGRDAAVGRRDNGPNPPAQTGANRVRVRSGRRWRKSGNAAGREKTGMSKERQQRSREGPAGERQGEGDKGGPDHKQFPSMQQDGRRARQDKEKEAVCRSPRCCHNVSPKACTQCVRGAQTRESQEEGEEGGECPRRGVPNRLNGDVKGMRKERQKHEEEVGLCELESPTSVLAASNPDLESSCPQSLCGCDGEEIREADSNDEPKTQTSTSKDDRSETETDTNSEIMTIHIGNNDFIHVLSGQLTDDLESRDFIDSEPTETPFEEIVANVNRFSDGAEADEESEKERERVGSEEETGIYRTPARFSVVSNCYEDVPASARPASISSAVSPESSNPAEGSICSADGEACWVETEQENDQEGHTDGNHLGEADPGIVGEEELDLGRFEPPDPDRVADESDTVKPQLFFKNEESNSQPEERGASSSLHRQIALPILETDGRYLTENGCDGRTIESELRNELESEEESKEGTPNPEEGVEAKEVWRREQTCDEPDSGSSKGDDGKEQHAKNDTKVSAILEDNDKEVQKNCASKDIRKLQESAEGSGGGRKKDEDTCSDTSIAPVEEIGGTSSNVFNVACADPSTSLALSPANPDPSPLPLGSMATGLPSLEEDEEEEGLRVAAGDGGQEGKRRYARELEEQRGSTVATVGGRKKGEEEEDEFGVFMQADGQPAWGEGVTVSVSAPCGSRGNFAGESTHWTPGWTDSAFHQSDDSWTAFPQDASDEGRDLVGQWWPTSAAEERRDRPSANQNLATVFAEAFPSPPGSSPSDPHDLDTVPTLTQLLRRRASQHQGLLDSYHDLNKMIGQRYKRANGVSRDLLLTTLHLEPPHTESRPAPRTASRRLSPGLPSANQHAQNAVAKRRLSYDHNRNVME
ncbi:uncharacterized protein si:ch211-14c7.2 isoform X2 [Scophthalmus maximus]|uniref:uncharacterized protein si:ch211-14c7.2 isoform X2 n=1 Tax=Scophthalmus maximus TaxID=52904 RepID=UPI001FA93143|nr:uncharacterized protein si:ch211-14c7.2 isoform X2 [Scophthalmus maximus]